MTDNSNVDSEEEERKLLEEVLRRLILVLTFGPIFVNLLIT